MEISEFIELIKRKKQTVIAVIFLFLLFGTFFALAAPKKYTSKSKLLVVQSVSKEFDLYSVSKSNSYLSNVLANVVKSNSFYAQTLNSGFDIDKAYFNGDTDKQVKIWFKTISSNTVEDSGIINISVNHTSQYQADQIAKAVIETLKKNHSQYHGAGEMVQIKTIDQPYTSKYPVQPNLFIGYILSLVFGIMSALTFIYIFPDERYDIIFFPGRKGNKISQDEVYDFSEERYSQQEQVYAQEAVVPVQPSPAQANYDLIREKQYIQENQNIQNDQPLIIEDAGGGYEENYQEETASIDDLAYEEVVKKGRMENLMKK
jgi:capsular polysaccharide biosynthesis protein